MLSVLSDRIVTLGLLSDRNQGGGEAMLIDMYSIQTWALEEARRRLEAEGILEDPDKKS